MVLGGILGAGCHNSTGAVSEYGMPSARYILDGVVTARATGQAVPGIRIFLSRDEHPDSSTAATSGADGGWRLDTTTLPCGEDCSVVTADVDGPESGGIFAPATIPLQLTQTRRGDGHWNWGTLEQHDISISLDPQALDK
jgi:putative lipoprotein (rSAM/lipoprotein system)